MKKGLPPKPKKITPLTLAHPMYGGKSLPRKTPSRKTPAVPDTSSEDEDSEQDEEEVGFDQGGLYLIPEEDLDIVH